jgi:uncharacterized protein YhhL (DUF1145 family)
MTDSQLRTTKVALGLVWSLAFAASLLLPGSTLGTIGLSIICFMLLAHMIECCVFWRSLRMSGNPLAGEILQALLFGYFHFQTIKQRSRIS